MGLTWSAASKQRGPFNTECKLLLLEPAFEALDCIAVELRTPYFNHQSRRAIERLGAKLDGILRNTCVYSITQAKLAANPLWIVRE